MIQTLVIRDKQHLICGLVNKKEPQNYIYKSASIGFQADTKSHRFVSILYSAQQYRKKMLFAKEKYQYPNLLSIIQHFWTNYTFNHLYTNSYNQMGVIRSIATSYSWNQYLFWYIQRKDISKIQWVLDNKPQIVNSPLTSNYKTTPLHRAAGNGSLQVCKLLVEKYNADVNYQTQTGQTPLMGAAKRDKTEVVNYLLIMGANTEVLSSNGFIAIEYAILSGFYETTLMIFQKMKSKELKHPLDYEDLGKRFLYRYVNYKVFVQNLLLQIEPQNVPDFLSRPKKVLNDPVVDPRQTWKQWFLRQMQFKDPPLCQRSQLPEELQPQNRRFGKIRHYLSKLAMSRKTQKPSFYPKSQSQIDTRDKLVMMKEMEVKSQKIDYINEQTHQTL